MPRVSADTKTGGILAVRLFLIEESLCYMDCAHPILFHLSKH